MRNQAACCRLLFLIMCRPMVTSYLYLYGDQDMDLKCNLCDRLRHYAASSCVHLSHHGSTSIRPLAQKLPLVLHCKHSGAPAATAATRLGLESSRCCTKPAAMASACTRSSGGGSRSRGPPTKKSEKGLGLSRDTRRVR